MAKRAKQSIISMESLILYNNILQKPFTSLFIKIENYVDGYGIGELPEHEFRRIIHEVQKQLNVEFNLG
jgi:hypothetical protein